MNIGAVWKFQKFAAALTATAYEILILGRMCDMDEVDGSYLTALSNEIIILIINYLPLKDLANIRLVSALKPSCKVMIFTYKHLGHLGVQQISEASGWCFHQVSVGEG